MELDRTVLVAPAGILRPRQVFSPYALREAISLIAFNRVPLLGRRLETISDNPIFRASVIREHLTPAYSDRPYVVGAAIAALRALGRPRFRGNGLILQGAADKLLTPLGARGVAWRLGHRVSLRILPGVAHGVLWDATQGAKISQEAVEFCLLGSIRRG